MSKFRQLFHVDFSHNQLQKLYVLSVLWATAEGMMSFYFPIYLEQNVSSLVVVGIVLGMSSVSSLVVDFILGFLADVNGYRRFFQLTIVATLLITLILLLSPSLPLLILVSILWGAQFEFFLTYGTNLYTAKHSTKGKFGKAAGILYSMRNVGYFLGPLLADYLRSISHEAFVIVLFVIYASAAVYILRFIVIGKANRLQDRITHLSLATELKIVRKHFTAVMPIFLFGIGISLFEAGVVLFGSIYLDRTTSIPGLIIGLGTVASVVVPVMLSGAIPEKFVKYWVLVCGLIAFTSAMLLAGTAPTSIMLIPIFFGISAAVAIGYWLYNYYSLEFLATIRISDRDEILSLGGVLFSLAYILIGVLGGSVIEAVGFVTLLIVTSSLMLFLSLYYYLILRLRERSRHK